MSNTNIEDLSQEDLIRILQRDRFVKEQMAGRLAAMTQENLELLAIIQELQGERQQTLSASNGEVPTPQVPADVTS